MILTGTTSSSGLRRPVHPSSTCRGEAIRDPSAYSFAALWHLLSLDAPTVAALWMYFLARCADVTLPWTCGACLFLAVWLLYAADRLLDARPLPEGREPTGLEERHRFHWRHRSAFVRMLAAGAVLLLLLLPLLKPRTLHVYFILSLALAVWLLLIHTRQPASGRPRPLPKEPMVGLFFGSAIAVPTLARVPELLLRLLPFVGLFGALCTLNCLFLYAWEHGWPLYEFGEGTGPEPARELASAHITTRWAARYVSMSSVLLILASLFAGFGAMTRTGHVPGRFTSFAFACGLSACLLLLLHAHRGRFERLALRIAGDAMLLTPLLFLHTVR